MPARPVWFLEATFPMPNREEIVMNPEDMTKAQLINELERLQQQNVALEALEIESKKAEETLKESEVFAYAEVIIETVCQPAIILDHDFRVITASRSYDKFCGISPEETIARLIIKLENQWDIPREVTLTFPKIDERILFLSARLRLFGNEQINLIVIEDVTENRLKELETKEEEEEEKEEEIALGKAHEEKDKITSKIITKVALSACKKISGKVVKDLRKMTEGMQSGDDSPLKTIWDEVCVQVQGEQSVMWEFYTETICDLIRRELAGVDVETEQSIWLQTDEGYRWEPDEENQYALEYDEDYIIEYILNEFVLKTAADWTNKRIEKFLFSDNEL